MAIDMSEVVGPENMNPDAKERVMDLLLSLPLRSVHEIKYAFFDWARQSGYQATAQDAAVAGARKKRKPG